MDHLTKSIDNVSVSKNNAASLPHIVVKWKDAQLQNRCTVYVWVLSGIGPSDLTAKVLDGGETLCLRVSWPTYMQDAEQLTKNLYCKDSSKVLAIETKLKELKNGSVDSPVTSEIDIKLGMQVEEQFFNEPLRVGNRVVHEKGNKLMRFFKSVLRSRDGTVDQVPIVIGKYEMMGIRDNYQNLSTYDSDYDDDFVQDLDLDLEHAVKHPAKHPEPSPPSSKVRKNRSKSKGSNGATRKRLSSKKK